MAVDEHTLLTMAAYGCAWPCASNIPSPKCLTYGCRSAYPRIPLKLLILDHLRIDPSTIPPDPPFLPSMAVYGHAHVSYGSR
eukprot:3313072-Pyramimonas_sp.AAC.1